MSRVHRRKSKWTTHQLTAPGSVYQEDQTPQVPLQRLSTASCIEYAIQRRHMHVPSVIVRRLPLGRVSVRSAKLHVNSGIHALWQANLMTEATTPSEFPRAGSPSLAFTDFSAALWYFIALRKSQIFRDSFYKTETNYVLVSANSNDRIKATSKPQVWRPMDPAGAFQVLSRQCSRLD